MRHLATLSADGVWINGGDQQLAMLSGDPVDQIVRCLGQIVLKTQSLSEEDQRRVRSFISTAHAALITTTSLDKKDQAIFETALRNSGK